MNLHCNDICHRIDIIEHSGCHYNNGQMQIDYHLYARCGTCMYRIPLRYAGARCVCCHGNLSRKPKNTRGSFK